MVFTYKFENYKIMLSQIEIIEDNVNMVIGLMNDMISFDYIIDGKLEFKVVIEVNNDEVKIIFQYDKMGLLVNLNFKEEETDYEEVNVDLTNVKKLSEINEEDITYIEEKIENSEGMQKLFNQVLEKYSGIQEEIL